MKTCAAPATPISRVARLGFGLALLTLFAGTASAVVDATLTPATTSTQAIAPVVLDVTGLAVGESIIVERIVDLNANGVVDPGESIVERFSITDGQVTSIAGIRNINVPGDEDTTADGDIDINITPATGSELGRLAGAQIIRISSPTAAFAAFNRALTLTQPIHSQSISGTVTDGANPVAYANVVLLDATTDGEFALGVVANAAGQYTVAAPVGSYNVLAVATGFVGDFNTAPMVVLGAGATPVQNVQIAAATTTISGKVADAGTSAGLGGVQVFSGSLTGQVVVFSTRDDGTFSVPVTAGNWDLEISERSMNRLGYLSPTAISQADTTGGAATGVNINVNKATALIYGTVTNAVATPLAGVRMGANLVNANNSSSNTITNANGYYVLGVGTGDWNVYVSSENPSLVGYVIPNGQNFSITGAQAVQADFSMLAVNAHLQGIVTNTGVPVSGIRIGAYKQSGGLFISAVTAPDGSFDLGVVDGVWGLQLEDSSAAAFNVVGPNISYTLIANQTINGIAYAVKTSTAQITGNVREPNLTPIPNANVYAVATISGVDYSAHAQTDGGGNYALNVIDGTWQVGANAIDYTNRPPIQTVVAGSNVVTNITLSKTPFFTIQPTNQTVNAGQTLVFGVNADSNSAVSYQWQVSVDGGTNWSNLSNDATYSTVTTSVLNVTSNAGLTGYRYRCVATNSFGSSNSNSALLTVNVINVAPSITLQPIDQSVTATQGASFTVAASGTPTPTFQWQLSTDSGFNWGNIVNDATYGGATTDTLAISATTVGMNGYRYRAIATNSQASASSNSATLTVSPAVAPSISSQPVVQTAVIGSDVTFSVTATGTAPFTYQWKRNGVNVAGGTSATLTVTDVQPGAGATYTVVVSNSAGSVTSNPATLALDTTPRLINVSCLASAGAGDSTLVIGFYLNGTGAKTLLIRGVGPTLSAAPFNRPGMVSDPSISVYNSGGSLIASNNDWDAVLVPDFSRMGAFGLVAGSGDAAMKVTLAAPGLYTVHLVNSAATADGLIEVYDFSRDTGSRLTNVSCRLNMKANETVILGTALIANPTPVLTRAIGPGLDPYVSEPLSALLPDPFLQVFVSGNEIASNDDWEAATGSYFGSAGAFPIASGSKDAAIRVVPTPGSLTIHATGKGASGIAIIEIYESQ